MNITLAYDRKRQSLVHVLCALALVFFVTLRPIVVSAEADTSQPAEAPATTEPIADPPQTEPVTSPETTTPTAPPSEPPVTTPGPQSPTGADRPTYTYDELTGLWTNGIYTWNPVTKQTQPINAPTYSYNPATGMWDTTEWRYDAPSGVYVENVVSVPAPPANAAAPNSPVSAKASGAAPLAGSSLFPGLLSDTNGVSSNGGSNSIFNLFYNAAISNKLQSSAVTGDATVSGNTLGGDATTGDALAIATILNLLQSSWNYLANGGLTTFVANLFGDLFGDIMIDPATTPQALSANTPSDTTTVTVSGSGSITNDVDLSATSGQAAVTKNTTGGNATSGNAYALANIVNSLGSSISAGSSFMGIINIFGNLDGDILLPISLMNLLKGSPASATPASNGDVDVTLNNTQAISNNVGATTATGDASVDRNTSAGNATSGSASSSLTILNLTGKQIVGSNALLVFVNVLGNWLGLIVDAPGSRAAALGDTNSSSSSLPAGSYTVDENQTINNNVTLSATSGDADVTKNTSAGDATSGDAVTSANIVNIINSALAVKDWFGILFINIFGDWNGSFGVNTAAGEKTVVSSPPAETSSPVVSYSTTTFSRTLNSFSSTLYSNDESQETNSILSAAIDTPNDSSVITTIGATNGNNQTTPPQISLFSIIGTVTALTILAAERTYSYRDKFKLRFWFNKA